MKMYSKRNPNNRINLMVCDGDGTLIDFDGSEFRSSWDFLANTCFANDPDRWHLWMEVAHYYNDRIKNSSTIEEEEELFKRWAEKDAATLRGTDSKKIKEKAIPYSQGVQRYFAMLQEKDVQITKAILSGGLEIIFERVKKELGFDICISNVLGTDNNGRFTGNVDLNVTLHNKLMRCVADIMYSKHIPSRDVISRNNMLVIGNDYNDLTILDLVKRAGGIALAFNPTFSNPENYVNGVIEDFMQIDDYVEMR